MRKVDFLGFIGVFIVLIVSTNAWSAPKPQYASNGARCTIVGTAKSDAITGTAQKDVICGLGGNDTINGSAGVDFIDGGPGSDKLIGGLGNDTLAGGLGNDTLAGGDGIDTASYSSSTSDLTVNLTTGKSTGAGSDTLSGNENIVGGSGNDTLTGSSGNNAINGGLGNDTLDGGLGNDLISPGIGADSVDGGAGSNTISYDVFTTDVHVDLSSSTATSTSSTDSLSNIQNVTGGSGNDTITGDSSNNVLNGGSGDDKILGLEGEDILSGSLGNDELKGGPSLDDLDGGVGENLCDWDEGEKSQPTCKYMTHVYGVVETEDGQQVAKSFFDRVIINLNHEWGSPEVVANVNDDGSFDFGLLIPGSHRVYLSADKPGLTATHPGGFEMTKEIVVSGNGVDMFVTLTMPTVKVVTVHVQNQDKTPVAGALITDAGMDSSTDVNDTHTRKIGMYGNTFGQPIVADENGNANVAIFSHLNYTLRTMDPLNTNRYFNVRFTDADTTVTVNLPSQR